MTTDTYDIVSDTLAEGAMQEVMASISFNKSTFIRNSVENEEQVQQVCGSQCNLSMK